MNSKVSIIILNWNRYKNKEIIKDPNQNCAGIGIIY